MKNGLYLHGKQGEATVTMTQHRQGYGASMDDGLGRWVAFSGLALNYVGAARTHSAFLAIASPLCQIGPN